jgi:hypothetical protein
MDKFEHASLPTESTQQTVITILYLESVLNTVAQNCNPSYLGDRGRMMESFKSSRVKLVTHYVENKMNK